MSTLKELFDTKSAENVTLKEDETVEISAHKISDLISKLKALMDDQGDLNLGTMNRNSKVDTELGAYAKVQTVNAYNTTQSYLVFSWDA